MNTVALGVVEFDYFHYYYCYYSHFSQTMTNLFYSLVATVCSLTTSSCITQIYMKHKWDLQELKGESANNSE